MAAALAPLKVCPWRGCWAALKRVSGADSVLAIASAMRKAVPSGEAASEESHEL